jgi:predicted site-specific integrase-resolvase
MFISPTNAVKMYNVSKPTLYKDMSDGTLSFDKDDRGRRKLNVAELDRLYDKREDAKTDLTSANVNSGQSLTESNVNNQQLTRQIKIHPRAN